MKSGHFSDTFFDQLPDDVNLSLMSICREFERLDKAARSDAKGQIDYLENFIEALAAFGAYANQKGFPATPPPPASNAEQTMGNIRTFFASQQAELTRLLGTIYLEQQTRKYADRLDADSTYVFSEGDYARIQVLLNEMREIITTGKIITEKHKLRLLERLERMQRELHKSTSDLDRFWGFIGEAGIVMGKFGQDIKPLFDRIKELADIVWKVVITKEKLVGNPTITIPELPPASDDGDPTVIT